jgi:hypothetical protein
MLMFSSGLLHCLDRFELVCDQRQTIDWPRLTLSAKVLRSGNFFQFPDSPLKQRSLAGDCRMSFDSFAGQPASGQGSSR